MGQKGKSNATRIDADIGSRMKLRRLMLGMSQGKLGHALGVTFQQVQKYENGLNRLGASKLPDVARVLKVPITFFYDGALKQSKQDDQPIASITRLLATPERLALVVAFEKIKDKALQRAVVRLVETIASDGD